MKKRRESLIAMLALSCMISLLLGGCVNQHPDQPQTGGPQGTAETAAEEAQMMIEITDPEEKAAVAAAKEKVAALGREPRIIATSAAVAEVCDKLNLDLVGICDTTVSVLPERYDGLPKVGTPMAPDSEIVSSLHPDWVLSPTTLIGDLRPKYETIGCDYAFLNLSSIQGLFRSIQELGEIFDRQEEAKTLTDEFTAFYEEYKGRNEGREAPKVLILMGVPGSFIIATENSYVGSLVELAGGINVYSGTGKEFVNVNTEDIKTKEPDIILRNANGLPDMVMSMFQREFEENDIWKHFEAVQNGRVYDMDYSVFGMSAKLNYEEALETLQTILYPEDEEDLKKAEEESRNARDHAAKSNGSEKYEEIMNDNG